MIELARYNQTTTNNRNYPFYGSNQIEDKIHFLFNSSKYSFIRNNFYNKDSDSKYYSVVCERIDQWTD